MTVGCWAPPPRHGTSKGFRNQGMHATVDTADRLPGRRGLTY